MQTKKMKQINPQTQINLRKNNIKYLFSFPFVLTKIDINVSESDPVINQLAYGVFLFSLVALICFINILGYIISYYLIQKGNYELKYLKLRKRINYFKGVTFLSLIIEGLLCFICLILLITFSILFIIK